MTSTGIETEHGALGASTSDNNWASGSTEGTSVNGSGSESGAAVRKGYEGRFGGPERYAPAAKPSLDQVQHGQTRILRTRSSKQYSPNPHLPSPGKPSRIHPIIWLGILASGITCDLRDVPCRIRTEIGTVPHLLGDIPSILTP